MTMRVSDGASSWKVTQPRVVLGSFGGPHDAVVGDLLLDGCLPAPGGGTYLDLPVAGGVVVAGDVADAFGESAEVLVLRPVVVDRTQRQADVQGLDDVDDLSAAALAAAALAATEGIGDLVLEVAEFLAGDRFQGESP